MQVESVEDREETIAALFAEALEAATRFSGLDWYRPIRRAATENLGRMLLPPDHSELWRHTPLSKFDLSRLADIRPASFSLGRFGSPDPVESSAVRLHRGNEVPPDRQEIVQGLLIERGELEAVRELQAALAADVSVLEIPKGQRVEDPIEIRRCLPEGRLLNSCDGGVSRAGASTSTLVIVVEEGASVTLMEEYLPESGSFLLPRVEIIVRPNAFVRFVSLQRIHDEAEMLARYRIHADRDSKGMFVHAAVGSSVSRMDLDLRILGPGVDFDLVSVSLADGARHLDFHPTQEHLAPHCRSNLYAKSVLKDRARSVYYGYIRVGEGAQKTDAYQTSRNLVLSPEARADAIPNLQIRASDVKCSHGASVGQVNAEELFYLRTRGLTTEATERLLVEGFFADAVARIGDRKIEEYVSAVLLTRLGLL